MAAESTPGTDSTGDPGRANVPIFTTGFYPTRELLTKIRLDKCFCSTVHADKDLPRPIIVRRQPDVFRRRDITDAWVN